MGSLHGCIGADGSLVCTHPFETKETPRFEIALSLKSKLEVHSFEAVGPTKGHPHTTSNCWEGKLDS